MSAAAGSSSLNLIDAVRHYIDKTVGDSHIGGMKVLLLDNVTTKVVSMVYSLTQVLEKEVYLVEQLGKPHESMGHMKAAVLIQPSEVNIDLLLKELVSPKFAEYHVFFTNIVSKDILNRLARADKFELVRQVHEYYADYMVVNEDFFHLNVDGNLSLSSAMSRTLEASKVFDRNVNGVLSLLLSVKRRPAQIRYQAASELARRVASDITAHIERDDIFYFPSEGPLLLILDRRDDPITPLLTQWTYQAMVHELLGLNNNRVDLRGAPGIKDDLQQVVLSCTQDKFFRDHRYANFGDLGAAVKALLDSYQKENSLNQKISSIEDMQNFLERYPDFRAKSINVSKHVAIVSEMSRLTGEYKLFDVSELEQEIACNNDHGAHKKALQGIMSDPKIQNADKLRLLLLFALRYENYDSEINEFKSDLLRRGVPERQLAVVDALLDYAGDKARAPGLYAGGGLISQLSRAITTNVKGVQNVYSQHVPVLLYTLESIAKNKLKDSAFPMIMGKATSRPSEIVVFMVGGTTFEEATKVAEFNATNTAGLRVILGGSCVHNSTSFLKEIQTHFGK